MSGEAPSFRIERSDWIALLFALALAIYHVHLLGRGTLAWPDEFLYRDAWSGVRALQAGDIREFARSITGFGARPLEALVRLPLASVQIWLQDHRGIPVTAAESLHVATSLNVLVSFLLTLVFYRLSVWIFESDRIAALLATVVFSLLVSTNIWIRHLLPYDTGMLLDLCALLVVFRVPVETVDKAIGRCIRSLWLPGVLVLAYPIAFYRARGAALPLVVAIIAAFAWSLHALARAGDSGVTRPAALAGVIAALATATYPAYYSLPAALAAVIFAGSIPVRLFDGRRLQWRAVCVYGASAAIVMFSFEFFSRIGRVSYLGSAARLSGTIALGNFAEGYVFLPKYLAVVEGWIGITIIVLAAAYVPLAFRSWKTMTPSQHSFIRFAIVMTGLYLVYGTQSTILHKMAFTERYVRMYIPTVVWAAIGAICLLPRRPLRAVIMSWCLIASIVSFAIFARDYDRVGYPLDALRSLRIGYEDVVPENRIDEMEIYAEYNLPVKAMVAAPSWITNPNDDRFALINFSWLLANGRPYPSFVPPPGARLIYDAPNFVTFRSAPFEGWMPEVRQDFQRRGYRLRVYQLHPPERLASPRAALSAPGGSK